MDPSHSKNLQIIFKKKTTKQFPCIINWSCVTFSIREIRKNNNPFKSDAFESTSGAMEDES